MIFGAPLILMPITLPTTAYWYLSYPYPMIKRMPHSKIKIFHVWVGTDIFVYAEHLGVLLKPKKYSYMYVYGMEKRIGLHVPTFC
uniref:Uncharacterized protein n=1 Tax=Arundo donax TaxID=35708 RepID=A0A0A9AQ97_ARUDO